MNRIGLLSLQMKIIGNRIVGKHAINELAPLLSLSQISSFYRKPNWQAGVAGQDNGNLDNLIVGVIRFSTDASPGVVGNHIRDINENNFDKSFVEGFKILCIDDLVVLSPEMTLPCPTLYSDNLVLRCASEVWPDFQHPILKKTIADIDYSNPNRQSHSFYMQGSEFLKF